MIPKKVFLICNYYENVVLWQIHNEYMVLKILNMHFFNISANYMHLVQKKRTWWPDMSLDFEGGGGRGWLEKRVGVARARENNLEEAYVDTRFSSVFHSASFYWFYFWKFKGVGGATRVHPPLNSPKILYYEKSYSFELFWALLEW